MSMSAVKGEKTDGSQVSAGHTSHNNSMGWWQSLDSPRNSKIRGREGERKARLGEMRATLAGVDENGNELVKALMG